MIEFKGFYSEKHNEYIFKYVIFEWLYFRDNGGTFIQDADNYEAEEIRTSSKGKILIRGVGPDNQSYTKAWISSQNQSLIEETCSDKNWEVVWDSGITNTGL